MSNKGIEYATPGTVYTTQVAASEEGKIPVLGGVAGVAHLITGHEQTKYNRVCYFHFFDVLLASKQNLFYYHKGLLR